MEFKNFESIFGVSIIKHNASIITENEVEGKKISSQIWGGPFRVAIKQPVMVIIPQKDNIL